MPQCSFLDQRLQGTVAHKRTHACTPTKKKACRNQMQQHGKRQLSCALWFVYSKLTCILQSSLEHPTYTNPETMPITMAPSGSQVEQPAVIPTSPARRPLFAEPASQYWRSTFLMIMVVTAPKAAEIVVVTIVFAATPEYPTMTRVLNLRKCRREGCR